MLKGQSSIKSENPGNSVKDQVKQALLKNRLNTQQPPSNQMGESMQKPSSAFTSPTNPQSPFASPANVSQSNTSGPQGGVDSLSPVVSKIEKTVDSINEVHTTMESLNRNMNLFVDLFNKRGSSLGTGTSNVESNNTPGNLPPSQESPNSQGSNGNQGQNAVTTLLLSNLLKKSEDTDAEYLKNYERGSPAYLELLTKKLEKFQSEFELLRYLFEPKTITGNLSPSDDAQGNSAWLAGFMSMMMNQKSK